MFIHVQKLLMESNFNFELDPVFDQVQVQTKRESVSNEFAILGCMDQLNVLG